MSTVETEGFKEFEQLLIKISNEFGYRESTRNVLTPSVKEAMLALVPISKAIARRNTGRMQDSIRVDARIPNAKDKLSSYVKPDDAVIAVLSAKQSAVSLGEEFGTAKKAGHPFLRPALEQNQSLVLRRLSALLAFRLNAYTTRKLKGK